MKQFFKNTDNLFVIVVSISAGLIVALVISLVLRGSCVQAKVINNMYGTSYTCSDMFYAQDTITDMHRWESAITKLTTAQHEQSQPTGN